jgi:hypothetical protein
MNTAEKLCAIAVAVFNSGGLLYCFVAFRLAVPSEVFIVFVKESQEEEHTLRGNQFLHRLWVLHHLLP